MGFGNVVNKFHNKYGFTDSGTTEKTDFTTFYVWGEKVDDFDTGFKNFDGGSGFDQFWWGGVDGLEGFSFEWASFIDWGTDDVDNSAQSASTDWDHNWVSGIENSLASDDSFSGVHSNGSDGVLSQMLGDFEDESVVSTLDFESVQNWWSIAIKLNVDNWTNNGGDSANHVAFGSSASSGLLNDLAEHIAVPLSVSST
jgi:hypothetical protein